MHWTPLTDDDTALSFLIPLSFYSVLSVSSCKIKITKYIILTFVVMNIDFLSLLFHLNIIAGWQREKSKLLRSMWLYTAAFYETQSTSEQR